jgi:hypothetical protein
MSMGWAFLAGGMELRTTNHDFVADIWYVDKLYLFRSTEASLTGGCSGAEVRGLRHPSKTVIFLVCRKWENWGRAGTDPVGCSGRTLTGEARRAARPGTLEGQVATARGKVSLAYSSVPLLVTDQQLARFRGSGHRVLCQSGTALTQY